MPTPVKNFDVVDPTMIHRSARNHDIVIVRPNPLGC
jgi:hypothetical protein